MDWFKHDVTAQMDIKIKKLVRNYGYEGYGVYWNVIELLYSKDGQMEVNELIEELDLTDNVKYVEVLERFGLIEIEDSIVRNRRVMAAISDNDDRRKRFSDMGKTSAERRMNKGSANVERTLNDGSTDVERTLNPCSTERKIDREIDRENKKKPSKEGKEKAELFQALPSSPSSSKRKTFSKPSLQEIEGYCRERNNSIDARAFFDFYESKNWFVGKNKMVDWKACVRTWEQRETREANQPEVIKGTNIRMAITADGSNPDRYRNSPTMEELYQMTRSGK